MNFGQIGAGLTFVKGVIVASVQAPIYAYLESQGGQVIQPLPVANTGAAQMQSLCRPIRAQTGMTIKVLTQVAAGTVAGVGLYGPNGADVFTSSYSNGNASSFTSVLTGLPVGQSLAGASVNKAITSNGTGWVQASGFPFVTILASEGFTKAAFSLQNGALGMGCTFQTINARVAQNDTMICTGGA